MDPKAANVVKGGHRPFHTIIPGFLTRGGKPVMSFGVMGGDMQPQGHVQVLVNLIDSGMNVQAAGDVAAVTGSNQVSLAAGAGIPANGSCTVTVLVTADAQGIYSNVIPAGALQTSVGDSPLPASADLIVTPPAVTDRIFASGFDG
jgi:gamma-glutamyltranspeptidase